MNRYKVTLMFENRQIDVRYFKKKSVAKRKAEDWYKKYNGKLNLIITVEDTEQPNN